MAGNFPNYNAITLEQVLRPHSLYTTWLFLQVHTAGEATFILRMRPLIRGRYRPQRVALRAKARLARDGYQDHRHVIRGAIKIDPYLPYCDQEAFATQMGLRWKVKTHYRQVPEGRAAQNSPKISGIWTVSSGKACAYWQGYRVSTLPGSKSAHEMIFFQKKIIIINQEYRQSEVYPSSFLKLM